MDLVTQFKNYDGRTFTTVNICLVSDRASAKPIREKLHGKTFMNFKVHVAPIGGSFNVFAQTTYDAPKDEILGMLLSVLAIF